MKSENDTQYRIWFKSPSGALLNETIAKDRVVLLLKSGKPPAKDILVLINEFELLLSQVNMHINSTKKLLDSYKGSSRLIDQEISLSFLRGKKSVIEVLIIQLQEEFL